jgi:DNA replication and repair protein RecF
MLSSIRLQNFRRHTSLNLNFSDKLNFIVGGNGQGKTSILEAIYYLCTTKGLNSKSDIEVLKFDKDSFEIEGTFENLSKDSVRIFFTPADNKKFYFLNNKQVNRSSEIIGKFPVVVLTPADHSITQGSPSERRRFIDSVLSQASRIYLNSLIDYNKTLKQRASLLNLFRERKTRNLLTEIDAWTEKLVIAGIELIKQRTRFIVEFNKYISDSYSKVMNGEETPEIIYSSNIQETEAPLEKSFLELINIKKEEEIRKAVNLVGPHRDDFIFKVNGINLKTFGSQGQHKTFQAALKFAEFFYLKEMTGSTPIFLLDDVFGELDTNRAKKISEYLRTVGQAFITVTDFANFSFIEREKSDVFVNLNNRSLIYA